MVHPEDVEFLKHHGYEAQLAKLKKPDSIEKAPQTQQGKELINSLFSLSDSNTD